MGFFTIFAAVLAANLLTALIVLGAWVWFEFVERERERELNRAAAGAAARASGQQ